MTEHAWEGLSPAQADGQACVVCTRSLRVQGSVAMPVGHSHTGSQVFACAGTCADTVTDLAERFVVVPAEALTAAGAAFLEALDRALAATPTGDPRHVYPDELIAATVHAAAPLIAATELRRLADYFQHRAAQRPLQRRGALRDCAEAVRARADELDPAGGAR